MFLSSLMALAAVLIMGVISPVELYLRCPQRRCALKNARSGHRAGHRRGRRHLFDYGHAGVTKVLTAVPEMFIGLKVAGGLYLLWLGYKIYRGAAQPWILRQAAWRRNIRC